MKNNQINFLKRLEIIGLFSLVLSASLTPLEIKAQVVLPAVGITASPSTICSGQASLLIWSSTDATTISISSGVGSVAPHGEREVFPNQTTTYTITGSNGSSDAVATAYVTVSVTGSCSTPVQPVQTQNPTVNLTADNYSVNYNGSTVVRWNSDNATSCYASGGTNGWYGNRATSGSFNTGSLVNTTVYNISCSNSSGSATDSVTISVNSYRAQTPTVNLTADDYSIDRDDNTIVRWNSDNATSCYASGGTNGWYGNRATSGSFNTGDLVDNTTFYINCSNSSGSATDSVTIRVSNYQTQYPVYQYQPLVVISADQTNIPYNGSTNIRWTSLYATSCYSSNGSTGWAGTKNIGTGTFYTGSLTAGRTYTITCSNSYGSATDSVTVSVRGQTVTTVTITPRPALTSLVTITSSVDRSQPIVPTIDNTKPRPGDEINYTVSYKNIGTGAITNLSLRIDLPLEVDYISSNPNSPTISGNTLVFNLGTLRANGQGTVTAKMRVRDNILAGTNLNFPATLSYIDPSGSSQSVNANVSAQVWDETETVRENDVRLGASIFGSGFLPGNLFGWLLLFIVILVLILLAKYIFAQTFHKETATITTVK